MKAPKTISILLMLFLVSQVVGQSSTTFIEEAKSQASEQNKDILMIFSGSDWCKPCIQLKETILDQQEFKSFSNDHLILLHLDFPYKKKNKLSKKQQSHNAALADKYNSDGTFPLVILFNKEEKVLGLIPYRKGMSIEDFITSINSELGI